MCLLYHENSTPLVSLLARARGGCAPPPGKSIPAYKYVYTSIIKNLNNSNKSGTRIPNDSESEKSKSHKTFETTFTLEQVFGFVKVSGFLVLQIKLIPYVFTLHSLTQRLSVQTTHNFDIADVIL